MENTKKTEKLVSQKEVIELLTDKRSYSTEDDLLWKIYSELIQDVKSIRCVEKQQPVGVQWLSDEKQTAEQIEKLADQFMCSGKTIGGGDSGWIRSAFIEGYKSASQQLAEKDKEIERLKTRKLAHQLFIGKVADILGVDAVTQLLKESNEALNK